MKIAVISDLHLGFRQYGSLEREQDFYNQLYKVRDEINKHNPNIVIIAGDLFDKPNPTPAAINAYREGIGNLNADIICTIKGNHTMILRDDHYSIDEFFGSDEFEGYYYLNDESISTHDFALQSQYDAEFKKYIDSNVQIDGITFRNNSNIDEFLEVQKEMAERASDNYRILVLHQSFKEFCGFTGEELSIEDINYSSYDVVICGHIHSRLDAKLSDGTWFIQPGSIERLNTLEAKDELVNGKGFYLIDTEDNSIEFYKVKCDREFLLGEISITSEEGFQKELNAISESISKLDIPPIISYSYNSYINNIALVREMINQLSKNALLDKSNINDMTKEDIIVEITDSEMPTVLEAIKIYGEKSNLNEKEVTLAIDTYRSLTQENKDTKNFLDNYYEKNKEKYIEKENSYPELDNLMEYFEKRC